MVEIKENQYMKLFCNPLMNGIMAYWEQVPDAACYNITLYINEQPISKRVNERTEMYCSFTGLAAIDGVTTHAIGAVATFSSHVYASFNHSGLDYYVKVEAENRRGEIIDQTDKVKCKVREF